MTLTELLVVVAVMVILIGMAAPMMRNGMEERKLREASRQLNTAFTLARAMAAETGRPAGVWIDTQSGTSYAQQVFMAETPPPYSGDIVGALTRVAILNATQANASFAAADGTFSLQSLVNVNDLIKFNYKGPLYRITAIAASPGPAPSFSVTIDITGMPQPPAVVPIPYQIFRQPAKSSSMPLELPAGVVIDLDWSGYGLPFLFLPPPWMQSYAYTPGEVSRPTTPNGFYYVAVSVLPAGGKSDSTEPNWPTVTGQTVVDKDVTWRCFAPVITVMFNPNGSVERLWIVGGGAPMYPTETIHFLVGKLEQVGTTPGNLQDNTCLWVSVSPQTGRVATAENAYDANSTTPVPTARQFAQSGQTMGGR